MSLRPQVREAVYHRDGPQCRYCRCPVVRVSFFRPDCVRRAGNHNVEVWDGSRWERFGIATLDHVVDHSDGGPNSADNLVVCCQRCNHLKNCKKFQKQRRPHAQEIGRDGRLRVQFPPAEVRPF